MCLFNLIALALANELMATPSDILILNIEITGVFLHEYFDLLLEIPTFHDNFLFSNTIPFSSFLYLFQSLQRCPSPDNIARNIPSKYSFLFNSLKIFFFF